MMSENGPVGVTLVGIIDSFGAKTLDVAVVNDRESVIDVAIVSTERLVSTVAIGVVGKYPLVAIMVDAPCNNVPCGTDITDEANKGVSIVNVFIVAKTDSFVFGTIDIAIVGTNSLVSANGVAVDVVANKEPLVGVIIIVNAISLVSKSFEVGDKGPVSANPVDVFVVINTDPPVSEPFDVGGKSPVSDEIVGVAAVSNMGPLVFDSFGIDGDKDPLVAEMVGVYTVTYTVDVDVVGIKGTLVANTKDAVIVVINNSVGAVNSGVVVVGTIRSLYADTVDVSGVAITGNVDRVGGIKRVVSVKAVEVARTVFTGIFNVFVVDINDFDKDPAVPGSFGVAIVGNNTVDVYPVSTTCAASNDSVDGVNSDPLVAKEVCVVVVGNTVPLGTKTFDIAVVGCKKADFDDTVEAVVSSKGVVFTVMVNVSVIGNDDGSITSNTFRVDGVSSSGIVDDNSITSGIVDDDSINSNAFRVDGVSSSDIVDSITSGIVDGNSTTSPMDDDDESITPSTVDDESISSDIDINDSITSVLIDDGCCSVSFLSVGNGVDVDVRDGDRGSVNCGSNFTDVSEDDDSTSSMYGEDDSITFDDRSISFMGDDTDDSIRFCVFVSSEPGPGLYVNELSFICGVLI
ncbi:hypothetical protein SNE40_017290 [Patella caerulea]|uniref:Uncharacterized protein n=1 Tax=Patella caerulea TaxID=87958 RepID=A0AAN8JGZ5_PATCE